MTAAATKAAPPTPPTAPPTMLLTGVPCDGEWAVESRAEVEEEVLGENFSELHVLNPVGGVEEGGLDRVDTIGADEEVREEDS